MAVTVYKEVEINLGEFGTDELIGELESRGFLELEQKSLLEKIWQLRRNNSDYQAELDKLLYNTIGKIL